MARKRENETKTPNVWGKILTGDANEYLPLFEFAKSLKLNEEYLIGLAKSGRLKAFKLDDYWLSTSPWVNEWLGEVKDHLRQEIGSEKTIALTPAALPRGKTAPLKIVKPQIVPSFYQDIAETKRELLEELSKENNSRPEKKWVRYVANGNSFKAILNTPLKLALTPQQTSHSHYALILALFFIVAAGLFIYTVALAGF